MPEIQKCTNCGGTDIECDESRGDTVCTSCGVVLENYSIVSEVQFEQNAQGGCDVIGQFVSADSDGAVKIGFGGYGARIESRQNTLNKAKSGITKICDYLNLTSMHVNSALCYYKMALDKNLTCGRRNELVQAACVYITCRVMGLPLLLIDISDSVKICCYKLGKTFLEISQALCIDGGIPLVDPSLYIMRYAQELKFGTKIQEVVYTAIRLADRMKKDSMHSGRRPSGLCGAALLIAARFHDFNRTVEDIVKVVRVHESTLRKRLVEFSNTPTSSLTLEEFANFNLEEGDEQDPPSFKAARRKEHLMKKLLNSREVEFLQLQDEIEEKLDSRAPKRKWTTESTVVNDEDSTSLNSLTEDLDCNLDDIDDDELNAYILNDSEVQERELLWLETNADYLEKQRLEEEEELGKERNFEEPKSKKRKYSRKKKSPGLSIPAAESIEKLKSLGTLSSTVTVQELSPPEIAQTTPELLETNNAVEENDDYDDYYDDEEENNYGYNEEDEFGFEEY